VSFPVVVSSLVVGFHVHDGVTRDSSASSRGKKRRFVTAGTFQTFRSEFRPNMIVASWKNGKQYE
jgi:hypothetical protein